MRLPNYEKNLAALEVLYSTIGAIVDCKKNTFKTKNLAVIAGKKDGHYFVPHIVHLVEGGYLSKERSGRRKNVWHTYSVNDWDSLRGYHKLIGLLLTTSENIEEIEEKLLKIKQI